MTTIQRLSRLARQHAGGAITLTEFEQEALEVLLEDRNEIRKARHTFVSFARTPVKCERARCGRHFREGYIAERPDHLIFYACSVECADSLAGSAGSRRPA